MTRPITQLILAGAFLIAAFVSWRAAAAARELATRHERLATLQASTPYWSGDYASVMQSASDGDASSLVTAANAAFRRAQRESAGSPSIERLDEALQAYASALKNGGFNQDAAYNFEYVARLRDAIAKAPRRTTPPRIVATPAHDDLPAGPTLHGRPGTHPPNTRGEEFEVITPMDYGEREAQPEPTPGRPLPRKG
jgi:hypothetical protein